MRKHYNSRGAGSHKAAQGSSDPTEGRTVGVARQSGIWRCAEPLDQLCLERALPVDFTVTGASKSFKPV